MAAILPSWIKKYGEEKANEMWIEYKNKCKKTSEYYENKYGKDYSDNLKKKKASYSLDYCIEKYGKELGEKKWNERLFKKIKTQKNNFKNKKWNNGRTLEEYQKRYGIEDGYIRWKKRNDHQAYTSSLLRYIDEYGEDAKNIIKKIKNNTSLTSFIERFGEEAGKKQYTEYINKLKLSSKRSIEYWINKCNGDLETAKILFKDFHNNTSLDKFIKKYGDDLGKEKYASWLISINGKKNQFYSKISQKLFWVLYNELKLSNEDTKFYELNEEQLFYKNNNIIRVDFKYKNKIIEFNGDYWHANPETYDSLELINGKEAKNIWEKDEKRIEWLKSSGYEVLIIWEKDYKKNTNLIIDNCKKFLLYE
jgi:hypothetical protein